MCLWCVWAQCIVTASGRSRTSLWSWFSPSTSTLVHRSDPGYQACLARASPAEPSLLPYLPYLCSQLFSYTVSLCPLKLHKHYYLKYLRKITILVPSLCGTQKDRLDVRETQSESVGVAHQESLTQPESAVLMGPSRTDWSTIQKDVSDKERIEVKHLGQVVWKSDSATDNEHERKTWFGLKLKLHLKSKMRNSRGIQIDETMRNLEVLCWFESE